MNNIDEFKTHTQNHIQNVTKLGMYLYYHHRTTYFKDVPEDILREKLLYHDFEKVAGIEVLKQFDYENEKPFSTRLYELYGRNISNTNYEAAALVRELNSFGAKFENEIFLKHGLINEHGKTNAIADKIRTIEKIADLVEREMNQVSPEEFGVRKMQSARTFLHHEKEHQMARELAKAYYQIVRPNPLIYIVKSNALPEALPHGSCSRLFN